MGENALLKVISIILQTIKRINGSSLNTDSLSNEVQYLMDIAHVSGVAACMPPLWQKWENYIPYDKKN